MEAKNGVLRLLQEPKGISVQDEWLDACVKWILEEEQPGLSEQRLFQLVYEQWLHADLRDVALRPSIPALAQDRGVLTGRFIVQVTSVADVGCAAYGQIQKLKGKSLDATEGADKKNFDPKPTRLLLLTLTDGTVDIQAMEYMPIPSIRSDLTPGCKLLLQGEIPHCLGMLLLSDQCVQILGGGVDQLAVENNPLRVLSRALHIEDSDVGNGDHQENQDPVIGSSSSHTQQERQFQLATVTNQTLPANQVTSNTTSQLSGGSNCVRPVVLPTDEGRNEDDQQDTDYQEGLDDFDDFNDFDDFEDDLLQTENGLVDDAGHDQWPDEFDELEQDLMDSSMTHCDTRGIKNELQSPFISKLQTGNVPTGHGSFAFGTKPLTSDATLSVPSKSKLSLKHNQSKTRIITKADHFVKKPPLVASVRPVQSAEILGPPDRPSSQHKEPFFLETLSALSNTSHPLVKVKAHFIKVCDRISHNGGEWVATVVIGDTSGARLTVQLSNKILELMIGFTADEFRNHIKPNRDNTRLKSKASKGFAHCQSTIAQLNCFMIILKTSTRNHPCVVQLLDY